MHIIIFTRFYILVNVDDVGQLREEKREEEGGKTSHQKVAEVIRHSQLRTEGGLSVCTRVLLVIWQPYHMNNATFVQRKKN